MNNNEMATWSGEKVDGSNDQVHIETSSAVSMWISWDEYDRHTVERTLDWKKVRVVEIISKD